jgi:hypothetical protein
MRGQTTGWIIGLIIVIIVLAGVGFWYSSSLQTAPAAPTADETTGGSQQPAASSEEEAVRSTVASFGRALQMVSLSASSSAIASSATQYYAPYVSLNLLAYWQGAPSTTPGRLTSSPWPDRIDITSAVKNADGTYAVTGRVVETTSAGGQTGSYPVSITLDNENGRWLITKFQRTDG